MLRLTSASIGSITEEHSASVRPRTVSRVDLHALPGPGVWGETALLTSRVRISRAVPVGVLHGRRAIYARVSYFQAPGP